MTDYITGFSIYTLAMIGVIFIALVVVKKCLTFTPHRNKNNFLKVENCLNIEPRKNLYVVKAGKERFLIASAGENCQFMTKLEQSNSLEKINKGIKPEAHANSDIEIPEIKSLKNSSGKYRTGMF